jgi:hypothetical protein
MSEYEIGDRVIVTVEYERTIADVKSHAGGTDYIYDRGLPAGGRFVGTRLAKVQPKKKKRRW